MTDRNHHIDKHAGALADAAAGLDGDGLLSTNQVAEWLGVSEQWLNLGRHQGFGPPFIVVAPRCIRYLRADVVAWLRARTFRHTKQYMDAGGPPRGKKNGPARRFTQPSGVAPRARPTSAGASIQVTCQ